MKKAFGDLELQDLHWVTRGNTLRKHHELRDADDNVVATMQQPSFWSNKVEVDAPGNRWTFDRKGFFRQYIEITSVGTGDQPATFFYSRRNKALEFPDGRVFYWKQTNFWGSKWAWTMPDGEPVVGFKTGGVFTVNGDIHIDPDATEMRALPLLLFLGWYLIALYQQDAAVAAAT